MLAVDNFAKSNTIKYKTISYFVFPKALNKINVGICIPSTLIFKCSVSTEKNTQIMSRK